MDRKNRFSSQLTCEACETHWSQPVSPKGKRSCMCCSSTDRNSAFMALYGLAVLLRTCCAAHHCKTQSIMAAVQVDD